MKGKKKSYSCTWCVKFKPQEPDMEWIKARTKSEAIKQVCEEHGLTPDEILECYREKHPNDTKWERRIK